METHIRIATGDALTVLRQIPIGSLLSLMTRITRP